MVRPSGPDNLDEMAFILDLKWQRNYGLEISLGFVAALAGSQSMGMNLK